MKKVSLSTILFLLGCFIAVLAAGLQWIIPGNQLFLSILAVGGVALAAWQKFRGDHEQRQQFDQERKTREAAEQNVLDQTEGGKQRLARSRILNTMNKDSQELHN